VLEDGGPNFLESFVAVVREVGRIFVHGRGVGFHGLNISNGYRIGTSRCS